jgi:hypothetical protein
MKRNAAGAVRSDLGWTETVLSDVPRAARFAAFDLASLGYAARSATTSTASLKLNLDPGCAAYPLMGPRHETELNQRVRGVL